ncbi:hypothetical protein ACP70R_038191 [Stipagrostis hirtigluma subsp. patula]
MSDPSTGGSPDLPLLGRKSIAVFSLAETMESRAEDGSVVKGSVKFNSSFSVNRIARVFGSLNGEKADLLREIGFAGLMHVRHQERFDRQFAFWLLNSMDHTNGSIAMKDGSNLELTDFDVHLVLGLPFSGDPVSVSQKCARRDVDKIKSILLLPPSADVSVEYLENLIVRQYGPKMTFREKNAFKVAAVLFADSYFIRPHGTAVKVNQSIFGNLLDVDSICKKNWASYLLHGLKRACCRVRHCIRQENKSITLDGCLILLQVFYLDNIEAGDMKTSQQMFPRVSEFTYQRIKRMIAHDRDGSNKCSLEAFGNSKLRVPGDVVYSRGRSFQDISFRDWHLSDELQRHCREDYPEDSMLILMEMKAELDEAKKMIASKLDFLYQKMECFFIEQSYSAKGNSVYQSASRGSCSTDSPCCFIRRRVHHSRSKKCTVVDSSSSGGSMSCNDVLHGQNCNNTEGFKDLTIVDSSSSGCTMSRNYQTHEHKCPETQGNKNCIIVDISSSGGSLRCHDQMHELNQHTSEGYVDFVCSGGLSDLVDNQKNVKYGSTSRHARSTSVVDGSCVMDPVFAVSPFGLNIFHGSAPQKGIDALMKYLPCMDDEDTDRMWFIHDRPSPIIISGRSMYPQFSCESDLSVDVMDAIVRMYKQDEEALYASVSEKRWRCFIEASWSVACLRGGIHISSAELSVYFCEPPLFDNISECRMFFVPVFSHDSWSCYAWDFQRKVVVVMDPFRMFCDDHVLHEIHAENIKVLHNYLFGCLELVCSIRYRSTETWPHEYLRVEGARCARCNSGLYVASYLIEFNGSSLNDTLSFANSPSIGATFYSSS